MVLAQINGIYESLGLATEFTMKAKNINGTILGSSRETLRLG